MVVGMRPYVDVLRALTQANVAFVVVGGVAVTLHGHLRTTVDLDLVIDLVTANVESALAVLTDQGLVPRLPVRASDFADPAIRQGWVDHRNLTVFSMHDPSDPRREVDLFADPPLDVHSLFAQAVTMQIGDVEVLVASRPHLIQMKRLAGRPQDLSDIAALQALDD